MVKPLKAGTGLEGLCICYMYSLAVLTIKGGTDGHLAGIVLVYLKGIPIVLYLANGRAVAGEHLAEAALWISFFERWSVQDYELLSYTVISSIMSR